jgi:hypothetical protein
MLDFYKNLIRFRRKHDFRKAEISEMKVNDDGKLFSYRLNFRGATYYVIGPVTANTFKLSNTLGGTSLTLTNGSGLSLDWYYTDPSMDRVETLFNSSFDFGKPYVAPAASSTDGVNAPGNRGIRDTIDNPER